MPWYNEKGEKAPDTVKVMDGEDEGVRFNPSLDPGWREENGFIYDTPPPRTVFTKLQIRRAMRALNMESALNALIESSPVFASDWADAQVIDLADTVMVQALAAGGITEKQIAEIRQKIEEQESEA